MYITYLKGLHWERREKDKILPSPNGSVPKWPQEPGPKPTYQSPTEISHLRDGDQILGTRDASVRALASDRSERQCNQSCSWCSDMRCRLCKWGLNLLCHNASYSFFNYEPEKLIARERTFFFFFLDYVLLYMLLILSYKHVFFSLPFFYVKPYWQMQQTWHI